jgi:hypothetical protein
MVEYITNKAWLTLTDVTMIMVDEVDNSRINKKDGSFEAKPMKLHLRKLQCFLLFYDSKSRKMYGPLDEEDVMGIWKSQFLTYYSSPEFLLDFANRSKSVINLAKNIGVATLVDVLTAQEFCRGAKCDMTHYKQLKEEKHFNSWNLGFIAIAYMHHTHLVLDANYSPSSAIDVDLFKEMQTVMYAVLQEHLKTNKGKSLVSQFEGTCDTQSIY